MLVYMVKANLINLIYCLQKVLGIRALNPFSPFFDPPFRYRILIHEVNGTQSGTWLALSQVNNICDFNTEHLNNRTFVF